jgi:pyridoxine/pyridoxamine 5'-phosphate oxidase
MTRSRYGVISSIASGGTPQSALVGIAITPELEIVFDTIKISRKYANLIERPVCSFVLWWNGEQTVQFEGVAIEPTGAALERYREAYFAVWTDGRSRLAWPRIAYLVVQPRWIRYSDFDQVPPLIEEMRFLC